LNLEIITNFLGHPGYPAFDAGGSPFRGFPQKINQGWTDATTTLQ
jgi:hypothetical protein